MQLDHVQIGLVNKTEKIRKNIYTTFFKRRNLFYMKDKGHVGEI